MYFTSGGIAALGPEVQNSAQSYPLGVPKKSIVLQCIPNSKHIAVFYTKIVWSLYTAGLSQQVVF